MTFMESLTACLAKFATFNGRASRSEYWWFALAFLILEIFTNIFEGIYNPARGATIENLIMLVLWVAVLLSCIPLIAVASRRLHDVGRSGWWQLLPVVPIIWMVKEGSADANEYGDVTPK